MNIQEIPLRMALNAAYAQLSRSGPTISKEDAIKMLESIQLAIKPAQRK